MDVVSKLDRQQSEAPLLQSLVWTAGVGFLVIAKPTGSAQNVRHEGESLGARGEIKVIMASPAAGGEQPELAKQSSLDLLSPRNIQTSSLRTVHAEAKALVDSADGSKASEGLIEENTSSAPASTAEAVTILVDKLLECPEDEELHVRALRSLRRISTKKEGRDLIGRSGGVQLVADCMGRFGKSNDNLAAMCCMVVANLAFSSEENKERIRRARIIDFLFDLLRRESIPAQDMSYVCMAAQNVTNDNLKNQVYMGAYGGIAALCLALNRHLDSADVRQQAVAALGNIACGGKTCQMKAREEGGVELILKVMQNSSSNVIIQEKCAMALRNLCHNNDRNSRVVGGFGGIDLIVLAMKKFSTVISLQIMACAALRYLSFDEENRERLGKNGGVVLIVEAIGTVQRNSVGLDEILKALSNATFDHTENKLAVARCNGIEVVMGILSAASSSAALEGGLRVLRNLTDCSEDLRRSMRDAGAMNAAVNCLRRARAEGQIAENALALLLNLTAEMTMSGGAGRELDPEEVCALCEEAMRRQPRDSAVAEYATALIAAMKRPADRGGDAPAGRRAKLRFRMFRRRSVVRPGSEAKDEYAQESSRRDDE